MNSLPDSWLALLAMVFLLGLRHGMDADHLATIDGLTRFNAVARPRLSRWSGSLFSLGHGLVVTFVAVMAGLFTKRWLIPDWMDSFGAWVSILFLLTLGMVNLVTVLHAKPDDVVQLTGLKGRFIGRLSSASHPLIIVLVGALFALSFDTMSQVALFSFAVTKLNGWMFSATLGLMFMTGMMVTDGLHGLWVSRLLRQSDRRACIASRVLGLTIATLSLMVATLGIIGYCSPQAASWSNGHGLYYGVGVAVVVLTSYISAVWITRKSAKAGPRLAIKGKVNLAHDNFALPL
ncbi:MAG: HoxN/HupN/NixA family nickel/cobalt transporter [Sulfuricaulis sp.]